MPGKTTGFGVSVAVAAAAAVPVPVRVVLCGDPLALSATDTVALKLAADAGVNVTEIVHIALAASVAPHVVVSAKSPGFVPPIVMPEMSSVALPEFDSVKVCAALTTPTVELNVSVGGESDALDPPSPVPLSGIDCVLLATFRLLSVSTMSPLRLPATVGVKFTETSQLAPSAKGVPGAQRFVSVLLIGKLMG